MLTRARCSDLQAHAIKCSYPIVTAYSEEMAKIINKALQLSDETTTLLIEALKPQK